ncbi:hypothetical protein MSAN_01882100 [Mycena sanguinolenta]|uniref:F-box domain-containing protein n=1 Tax=Mycena sanguinolenta TaxID=230812 RepID=A0A8H7CQL1_9AGAR|nr:hypothetical protein MSAN_01882100 [Mycena sanguinolenta]
MESPFSSYFHTNYVPSSEEFQCIQMDLALRAQELARLDARISDLTAQRDQLQAYVDSHKALISHPRRLPPDIVCEIFAACLPTERNAVMSAQEAPLLLSRICSAWRTIALSTPRLWASLHVPFEWVLLNQSRTLAVVQWLQRSGARPISLSVTFDDFEWADESSTDESFGRSALLRSLADFSARWRHVELMQLSSSRARELAGMRTPTLESLKLTGDVSGSKLAALDILRVPTLRNLIVHSWSSDHLDDIVLTMPLVWDQLTHLTFQCNRNRRGFLLRNVLVVLERCKRLVSLEVRLRDSVEFASDPMLLPCLEILIVEGSMQAQSLSYFIDHVSMPGLRKFRIPPLEVHGSFSFASLGTRSPLIESLEIVDLPSFTDQSLSEILQSLQSLHKLVVSDGESRTTQLLNLLTPKLNAETALCPSLQELVINYCGGLEKSTLDAFVQGRAELGFRHLEFKHPQVPGILSEDHIQSIISQGLKISIVQAETWIQPFTPWTGL